MTKSPSKRTAVLIRKNPPAKTTNKKQLILKNPQRQLKKNPRTKLKPKEIVVLQRVGF